MAIVRCVNNVDQTGNVSKLDVVVTENLIDFFNGNSAVLVNIEKTERLFKREGLVAAERYSSILNVAVRADDLLDHSQEHEVLNLALFLSLFASFLLFTLLCFLGFDLSVDCGSLLGSLRGLLVALLLTLLGGQAVISVSGTLLGASGLLSRCLLVGSGILSFRNDAIIDFF